MEANTIPAVTRTEEVVVTPAALTITMTQHEAALLRALFDLLTDRTAAMGGGACLPDDLAELRWSFYSATTETREYVDSAYRNWSQWLSHQFRA